MGHIAQHSNQYPFVGNPLSSHSTRKSEISGGSSFEMGYFTPNSDRFSVDADLSLRGRRKSSRPTTPPIPLPIVSKNMAIEENKDEMLHATTASLKDHYELSTWQMYHRISDNRKLQKLEKTRRGILSKDLSFVSHQNSLSSCEDWNSTTNTCKNTSDPDMIFDLEL